MKGLVAVLKEIRRRFYLVKDYAAVFLRSHRAITTPINFDCYYYTGVPFNPQLCRGCQRWNDLGNVFKRPHEDFTHVPLEDILLSKECIICRVVGLVILDRLQATDRGFPVVSCIRVHMHSAFLIHHLDLHSLPASRTWLFKGVDPNPKRWDSVKCVLYLQIHDIRTDPPPSCVSASSDWLYPPSMGVQLSFSYQDWATQLTRVRAWDTPFFDTQLVKRWVASCRHQHRGQCNNIAATLPPGFRIIDVEELRVTEIPHPAQFVAFSYMWNSSVDGKDLQLLGNNLERLQEPGGIDIFALPDAVADALRLCKDLGERYLWVDRLCIVQDDSLAKHSQIVAMDSIYGMASLTIVAAVDPSQVVGLPGVGGRPRKSFIFNDTRPFPAYIPGFIGENSHVTIDDSAWNTRGWTFQEHLLSLRCLYITEFQVYFSCPQKTFQEEYPKDSCRRGLSWIGEIKTLQGYLEAVSQYSARKLSYHTDILNAFAGVENMLSKQIGTTFFFGFPERYLTQALLWYNTGPEVPRSDVPEIPSWSWAAWVGPIHSSDLSGLPIHEWDTGALVKFHIQDFDKGLQPLEVQETWFGEPQNIHEGFGEHAYARWSICMPTTSETDLIWRNCPQNPWDLCRHTTLDPVACELARKYPGCLVFNTTVASLRLKKTAADNETIAERDDEFSKVSLDICNEEGRKIGHMEMGEQWMERVIDINEKHDFLVLCGGLLPERERVVHYVRSFSRKATRCGSPWLLMVMLIQRVGTVARRLGLGFVEARLWATAEPSWETIVLT